MEFQMFFRSVFLVLFAYCDVSYCQCPHCSTCCKDLPEFYINFCGVHDKQAIGFHILNAAGGHWPVDQFCQAVSSAEATTGMYDITIRLYNFKGSKMNPRMQFGFPGLIFNARDSLNYDFIYFRLHKPEECFQTGYMDNGTMMTTEGVSSHCPLGPPEGKTWFTVQVLIRSTHWAYLLVEDCLVTVFQFHYSPLNRGGALAANGYNNLVFFKGYRAAPTPSVPPTPTSKGCKYGTGWLDSHRLVANADHGTWPEDGFCRLQHYGTLVGPVSQYEVRVTLENIRSLGDLTMGNPGVIYNIQDLDNFDFIYFRPYSTNDCYQVGYMIKGEAKMEETGMCPGGPPKDKFHVSIRVYGTNTTDIMYNQKLLVTVRPFYPLMAKMGLIVANGHGNIIMAHSMHLLEI